MRLETYTLAIIQPVTGTSVTALSRLPCLKERNLDFNLLLDNLTNLKPFCMNGRKEFIPLIV